MMERKTLGNKIMAAVSLPVCLGKNVRQFSVSLACAAFKVSALAFLATLLFTGAAESADAGKTSCSKSCSQVHKNQRDGGCGIASSGGMLEGDSSTKLDANCIKRNSANGCFNAMPIEAGTGNYTMAGRRNPNRNHYGTDIGATGYTNSKVYAAADGRIVYARNSTGGGRTIAIEHQKKCTGDNNHTYTTIYRHLRQYFKTSGFVKKDEAIGIVGGSNFSAGRLCDNPAQGGVCKSGYYAIHLHFELLDGSLGNSTQASASRVMQPSCQNASVLCGGCPGEKCGTRKGAPIPFGSQSATSGWVNGEDGSVDTNRPKCSYDDYLITNSCTFCALFRVMFNAASQIALMADNGLLKPTYNLVKIGFLIWLAIYLLKQFVSFKGTNPSEMAKGILFQGFRVAVVALILSSTASLFYVMDLTLNPVMMTGLNFIKDLNTTSTCDKNSDYMQNIKGYSAEKGYSNGNPDGGLSKELGESIICSIKNMEDSTSLLMKLGKFSVCLAFNDHTWLAGFLPHLGYLMTGILLWLAGLGLLLTFPWCLVDCVLQLCIAAALVPCAIGAYAFKITSKYLKIIWDFFMNAMFNFVFMAIIVYIINNQLQNWLGVNLSGGEGGPDSNHEMFIKFSGLAWYGMGFIRVGAVCFFCYVFFDEAKSMAEKFASSPGLGGGKGIGRMVGGTVADAAGKTGNAAMHATGKVAQAAGGAINYAVGNQYRNMRNHAIGALASRFGKNASVSVGEDANGKKTTVAHQGNFRIFGRDIKVSATKGEDGKWTLTRETHKRSGSDKAFEKVLDKNGNEVKDENGNVKYRARHRVMGVTTGYEDMVATKDENGNLVYTTADGKSQFHLDEDGQIASYKTRFTRSYLGLGKAVEKNVRKQYGTNRVVNTTTSRTTERMDALGNVTAADTKMQDFNLFNRDLVRKDGTINIDTFNELQKNMKNPEEAAKVLVAKVMEKRGMKLNLNDPKIKVKIDDKGKVSIQQVVTSTDKDGKEVTETKNIQAEMIGDQMFVSVENIDKNGNITLNESNGIFHTVQTATKQSDGTYVYNFDGGFSEHAMSKNGFQSPLNHKGRWGNNIDRDKAMAGFTQGHYDKYLAKLQGKQMERTMSTGEYNRSAEAATLHSMIHNEKLNSLDEVKQNMADNTRDVGAAEVLRDSEKGGKENKDSRKEKDNKLSDSKDENTDALEKN